LVTERCIYPRRQQRTNNNVIEDRGKITSNTSFTVGCNDGYAFTAGKTVETITCKNGKLNPTPAKCEPSKTAVLCKVAHVIVI